ncbi:MAG TPA: ribosome maturation factor RimP [Campylobacterales bacterium]|nr:ribosome maturation factor RimP [Campylobacterales bacterium]
MDNQTLKRLIEDSGMSLYDTEIVTEGDRRIYRIFITSKDGVSLNKCSEITKIISPILDIDPPVNGEYTLEVSSPGIDRKLITIDHFKNSIDELVKIKLVNGEKFKCKILKVENKTITLYDKGKKVEKEVNFADIIKAKTYFEW